MPSARTDPMPRYVTRRSRSARGGGGGWWLWILVPALVILAALAAWKGMAALTRAMDSEASPQEGIQKVEPGEGMKVQLCFSSPDATHLAVEEREIESESDPRMVAVRILNALMQGPSSTDFAPTLPSDLGVRDVFVSPDGCAIVDLQSGWTQTGLGGTSAEMLAIYSMVNSLVFSVPQIRTVRFLVDGKETESLLGHLDARTIFHPNSRIMKEAHTP